MKIPYIKFMNDQLKNQPSIKENDEIICPHCGQLHKILFGTDVKTKKKTNSLGSYRCGKKSYLAVVNGKLIMGLKPVCSGKIHG